MYTQPSPLAFFWSRDQRMMCFDPITRNPCDLIGLAIFAIGSRMCTSKCCLFYLISYAEEFQSAAILSPTSKFQTHAIPS